MRGERLLLGEPDGGSSTKPSWPQPSLGLGFKPTSRAILDEIAAVARAQHVSLSEDIAPSTLTALEGISRSSPSAFPSLYEDIVHGRPIEIDALNGAIVCPAGLERTSA